MSEEQGAYAFQHPQTGAYAFQHPQTGAYAFSHDQPDDTSKTPQIKMITPFRCDP